MALTTAKIEIISRASSQTGNGALSSIDEAGEVARISRENYEAIAEAALTKHEWRFARRSVALVQLAGLPEKPWARLWAKPAALLSLDYICDGRGVRLLAEERDTPSGPAFALLEEAASAFAVGSWRVSEDRWPADFAEYVQVRMEAAFHRVNERHDEAEKREAFADALFSRVRNRDVLSSLMADVAEEALTKHPWRFARRSTALVKLIAVPEKPWASLWTRPSDLLALDYLSDIRGVRLQHDERDLDAGPAYAVMKDVSAVRAVGTHRVAEDRWPADFAEFVRIRREAAFHRANEREEQAAALDEKADQLFREAKARDVAAALSNDIAETALTAHGWKFARRTMPLTKLIGLPEGPWAGLWGKPSELLSVDYLVSGCGRRVEYEERDLASGAAFAVHGPYEAVSAVGTYRVAEERWPADFAEYVRARREAAHWRADGKTAQAEKREEAAYLLFRQAKARDGTASTPSDPHEWDLTRARSPSRAWNAWRR